MHPSSPDELTPASEPAALSPFDSKWRPPLEALRTDSSRNLLTQALFLELKYDSERALYSIGEHDRLYEGKWYPSIRRLYLDTADPTEYEFAKRYFYSWDHWDRVSKNKLIAPYVEQWRDELAIALRSRALLAVIRAADGGNVPAQKWVAEGLWKPRRVPKGGDHEKPKPAAATAKSASQDFARIASLIDRRKAAET